MLSDRVSLESSRDPRKIVGVILNEKVELGLLQISLAHALILES